jgi:hypothetical protein
LQLPRERPALGVLNRCLLSKMVISMRSVVGIVR